MARKCICKICKAKGDTDTFYKVTDEKGKNRYYCNQQEFETYINEKVKREDLIKYIAEDVLDYEEGQIVPVVLLKKIQEMNKFYDYEVIHDCFKENQETIQYWIDTKNFTSEYGMVSYIMKIIEGSINDVYKKWKFKKRQNQKQQVNSISLDIINEINTDTVKKKNKSIMAFLDEEDV